eukprot:351577-Chlamydomonas_euryale.AAC.2
MTTVRKRWSRQSQTEEVPRVFQQKTRTYIYLPPRMPAHDKQRNASRHSLSCCPLPRSLLPTRTPFSKPTHLCLNYLGVVPCTAHNAAVCGARPQRARRHQPHHAQGQLPHRNGQQGRARAVRAAPSLARPRPPPPAADQDAGVEPALGNARPHV